MVGVQGRGSEPEGDPIQKLPTLAEQGPEAVAAAEEHPIVEQQAHGPKQVDMPEGAHLVGWAHCLDLAPPLKSAHSGEAAVEL